MEQEHWIRHHRLAAGELLLDPEGGGGEHALGLLLDPAGGEAREEASQMRTEERELPPVSCCCLLLTGEGTESEKRM